LKILLLLFAVFLSVLIVSCGDTTKKVDTNETSNNATLDTNKYAIILSDTSLIVTSKEIESLYAIIKRLTDSINKVHIQSSQIEITRYKFQIIPLQSKTGQKLFWVNSFCDKGDTKWKNEIYSVKDGGKCFFNLKINLTTQTYFDLVVNDSS